MIAIIQNIYSPYHANAFLQEAPNTEVMSGEHRGREGFPAQETERHIFNRNTSIFNKLTS